MVPPIYLFISLLNGAIRRQQLTVNVPYSNEVRFILLRLRSENYIRGFSCLQKAKTIKIYLNYFNKRPVLKQISAISKPGRKVFASVWAIKKFLMSIHKQNRNSTFLLFFRTQSGILTHNEVFREFHGGQPICIAYC